MDEMNDKEKQNLLAGVANLYYNSEFTQNQIADRLFISRSKVSRLLQEARELGVVEIIIHEPWERDLELEEEIKKNFNLNNVRILTSKYNTSDELLQKLGEAAAYYIDGIIDKNTILGMSWGNTIYKTVQSVKSNKNIPLTVVPIMGAATISNPEKDSLDLSKQFASAYGGKYTYIYAPLFVSSEALKNELIQDHKIKEALSLAQKASIILTSVGSIQYKSWKDYLKPQDLMQLQNEGAVGHIGGHFYDINGKEIRTGLSERMIAIDLDSIRKTKNVVCVAGLVEKAEAILGAIRGGFLNTLITDYSTALKVVEYSKTI